jgi:hypothetical protein
MEIVALEGIVEQGQIKLKDNVQLPEKTKVYVIVPQFDDAMGNRVYSPRLAHPEQAKDFKMQIIKD